MIYSKLNPNILLNRSKETLLFNQRCLLYSSSILNNKSTDLNNNKKNNKLNSSLSNRGFLSSNNNFNFNYLINNKQNVSKNLPILFKEQSKSLSTQTDPRLEFKKINTSGDLNLIIPKTNLENILPKPYLPYFELLRLNKLTGTMFLLYPCLWSIGLGSTPGEIPSLILMGKFIIGATLMRSAGCIINDLMDKNYDKQVERTKLRPLATGRITEFEAIAALAACLTGSLHILLSFDPLTITYGVSSLLLVTLYPLMKRITNWPQLFLGFTFNWGAILGWSAVSNGLIDWKIILPLYASGIFWTLIYDTMYAYQDYHHDKKLGLKSTTMIFKDNPKIWLSSFAVAMNSSFLLTGILSEQLYPFYLGLGLSCIHSGVIINNLNVQDPNNCANQFRYSQFIGYYILMGILLSTLFNVKNKRKEDVIEVDIDLREREITSSI